MGRPKKVPGVDPPARREQILDAAIHLFAEKGIAGTSTKDIADAVHLTKSMVHYYFSSKAALVIDAQERAYRRYQERVRAKVLVGPAATPRRRAVDSLRDLWDAVQSDPELQKIQIQAWGEATRDKQIREKLGDSQRVARQVMADGIREAIGPAEVARWPVPVEAIAELLLSVFWGLSVMVDPQRPESRAVLEIFIGLLLEAQKQYGGPT